MVDWSAIKTEYITGHTSYRKLAEKYGIHYKVVSDRGGAEGWVELRSQFREKTLTKTLNAVGNAQAGRAARLQTVADKLLSRIERLLDGTDEMALDTQSLKQISGTLKDIKEIQMVKSDIDLREQEARIRNLEKQAQKDDQSSNEVIVTIKGADASWSK